MEIEDMLNNRVLVQLNADPNVTASGLELPEDSDKSERPITGTVIGIGEDVNPKLKLNDKVMFGSYHGIPLEIEEKPHYIVAYPDLFAIIK